MKMPSEPPTNRAMRTGDAMIQAGKIITQTFFALVGLAILIAILVTVFTAH